MFNNIKNGGLKMARIYDMKQKEVINSADGIRYGFISDLDIDIKSGKINNIIIPGPGKVLGMFGRDQEYRISWDKIKKIGDDIIIVELEDKDDEILVDSD